MAELHVAQCLLHIAAVVDDGIVLHLFADARCHVEQVFYAQMFCSGYAFQFGNMVGDKVAHTANGPFAYGNAHKGRSE